ncbi:MAG: hypothetical protein VKP70_09950 [Cyanobacteriota bacterium]|nr:hypothetical protein [Cyanobacteriota bacterium]
MSTESSSSSLAIVVGAPPFRSALPQDQAVLVIEADPQRLSQLKLEVEDQLNLVKVVQEVLTAEEGTVVEWHHFNDGRLDGPAGLATWQPHYPNLELLDTEQRLGRPLKKLVQAWADEHAPNQPLLLTLELRQGDPLAALRGLGPWIPSVQRVHLDMPMALDSWQSDLDRWLVDQGFAQTEGGTTSWDRDPVATLQRIAQRQAQEIEDLESLLQDARRQGEQERAHALALQEQLDQTQEEINKILALLDQA